MAGLDFILKRPSVKVDTPVVSAPGVAVSAPTPSVSTPVPALQTPLVNTTAPAVGITGGVQGVQSDIRPAALDYSKLQSPVKVQTAPQAIPQPAAQAQPAAQPTPQAQPAPAQGVAQQIPANIKVRRLEPAEVSGFKLREPAKIQDVVGVVEQVGPDGQVTAKELFYTPTVLEKIHKKELEKAADTVKGQYAEKLKGQKGETKKSLENERELAIRNVKEDLSKTQDQETLGNNALVNEYARQGNALPESMRPDSGRHIPNPLSAIRGKIRLGF